MNYPFLYQIVGKLNAEHIRSQLTLVGEKHTVWDDWTLQEVQSKELEKILLQLFPNLEIFHNKMYISAGVDCNFHIDRFEQFHLLHRILIPLDSNYHYEWDLKGQIIRYQPTAGEVIVFNNMIPHRFATDVSGNNNRREVIYVDLIDPLALKFMKHFDGNYSELNGHLASKYKS